MKRALFLLTLVTSILLTSCSSGPKKAADNFLNSMVKHDYEKAASYCGYSKDLASKELVITVILEQFGTDMRSFVITKDSVMSDKDRAVVIANISYNNNIRIEDYPIYLKRMGDTWVVDPFTIDE